MRRILTLACLGLGLGLWHPQAGTAQTAYPTRPITVVMPYAPGGAGDTLVRLVGKRLGADLGQTIVVENRSGASGNIGSAAVARSAADGYTLLVVPDANITINPHAMRDIGYDPRTQFVLVAPLTTLTIAVAVHPSLPVTTLDELVRHARAHPNTLSFGSPGLATPHHLLGEVIASRTGIEWTHVPYRGGGQAVGDLVSGRLQVGLLGFPPIAQFAAQGRVRILAVGDTERLPALPNVPTVAEALSGLNETSWFALFAPAGTPEPILAQLRSALARVMAQPAIRERLAVLGMRPIDIDPAAFQARIAEEFRSREVLIRDRRIEVH